MSPVPPGVAAFRARYRAEVLPRWYNGWAHFAVTSAGALSVIGASVAQLEAVSALELVTVPATFLFANAGEYFGHRGPMHHPSKRLGILYRRHGQQHHRFFTADAMEGESARDFHMVLFPPVMLLFFLGALAAPVGALLFLVASSNVAWLFVATALAYFLTYEWLHFAYHLPEDGLVARLPGMAVLRRLHTAHHDPTLMQRYNFNITFPICDALFGTYRRARDAADGGGEVSAGGTARRRDGLEDRA